MRIHTLWKMWDDEGVELLFALDERTVEDNWEAWETGLKAACAKYKITEADTRVVIVEVPYSAIQQTFYPLEIEGEIA